MPRAHRINFPGAYYHLFNRGVDKMPIARDDQDRRTFMSLWSETVKKFELRLFAYCLMNNHYHFFIQTPKKNLPEAMWHFSLNYGRYFNERHERVGPVYQDRYQSRLVDQESYALALTRYIHQNPAEASLVKKLEDYPWSSYGCYTGHFPEWNGLERDWILKQFSRETKKALEAFVGFHQETPSTKEKKRLSNFRFKLI